MFGRKWIHTFNGMCDSREDLKDGGFCRSLAVANLFSVLSDAVLQIEMELIMYSLETSQ